MKVYPVGWFKAPSKSFHLFAGRETRRSDGAAGGGSEGGLVGSAPDFDEMVHVDGKQVVWSAGHGGAQRVYKSYRQVLSAKQALLASFVGVGSREDIKSLGVTGDSQVGDQQPAQNNFGGGIASGLNDHVEASAAPGDRPTSQDGLDHDDRCLCVLQGLECVKIYAPDGAEFEVALPCKAARMWALPRGILIERAVPGSESEHHQTQAMDTSSDGRSAREEEALGPMFFSLLHPLEELKPVSYTAVQAASADASSPTASSETKMAVELEDHCTDDGRANEHVEGEFMCDVKQKILFVDNDLCLVVSFHEENQTHSVWFLLPATAVNTMASAETRRSRRRARSNSSEMLSDDGSRSSSSSSSDGFVDDFEVIGAEVQHNPVEEDDDDLIESEVFMQLVWTSPAGPSKARADSVFVSHDVEGTPLICLMHTAAHKLEVLCVKTESCSGNDRTGQVSPPTPSSPALLATPLPSLVRALPKDRVTVSKVFELDAVSAQPILATSSASALDIIVLNMHGELDLYRGDMRLCRLNLVLDKIPPQRDALLPFVAPVRKNRAPEAKPELGRIVDLQHAVSSRVNVVFQDGSSLRVTTAMSFNSRLLRPCLLGMDNALPAQVSLRIRVDVAHWYDLLANSQDRVMQGLVFDLVGGRGLTKSGTHLDLEWAAFVVVLALLLLPQQPSKSGAAAVPVDEVQSSWFEQLLDTDFHRAYELENRALLPISDSAQPETESKQSSAWFDVLQGVDPGLMTSKASLREHLRVLLLCLHLVYEECKLSTVTWPLIRPFAGLLGGLVQAAFDDQSAARYMDHYARDLGSVDAIALPALPLRDRVNMSTAHPPDVLSWLSQRMRKASTSYHTKAAPNQAEDAGIPSRQVHSLLETVAVQGRTAGNLSGASAMLRPFPELDSCFRTQQLCCFLELLAGGNGDEATVPPLEFRLSKDKANRRSASKSPVMSAIVSLDGSLQHWMDAHGYEARNAAERTVLGMVWFNFTLQDLETLTFGLGIPLREALHFCRANPSGRWPADAYVLVGREDMAALALAPPPPTIPAFMQDEMIEAGLVLQEQEPEQKPEVMEGTPLNLPARLLATPLLKTPPPASSKRNSARSSVAATSSSVTSKHRRRLSNASWATVTTAVTPVWRRLPSGQGVATHVADDILWGGENITRGSHGRGHQAASFLQHQIRGQSTTSSTCKLLSIADFARLSTSASAEVGTSHHGEDIFSFQDGNAGSGRDGAGSSGTTSAGNGAGQNQAKANAAVAQASSDPSGFLLLQRMTTLRFGSDRRILEVCRLLRSSHPVRLVVERGPETSDHELVAAQQARLLLVSRRTMSLSVGRGMITLGTVRPLLTDTVDIPTLSLSGKIPPNNAVVKLDMSSVSNAEDVMSWPRFHNGAAAGLRLAAGKQITPLTRTWIAYNRPETPNHTHAGFLLALGLHGHLAALTMADIYEYLAQGHDATTVGVMLGLSAAKRATMAPTVSKMLCLHIPSLLPAAFSDMEVPSVVQTAAIMGVGLLYQGTAHRLMTEFLLAEIGRRPTSDRCGDRESYSLSAGLALGLVTLGYGARPGGLSGLADLRLEDRLHRYMVGGLDKEHAQQQANGMAGGVDPSKCSRVREGPYVNVNVTSPGATLALAFIYMKSGNESVATRLAIPDTHFLLDYVRPDLLMLRVIARSLVLWDTVEPTEGWLLGQIPPAIRFSFERLVSGGTTAATVAAASAVRARHAPTTDGDEKVEDGDDDFEMVSSDGADMSDEEDHDADDQLPQPPAHGTPASTGPRRRRAHSHDGSATRPRRAGPIARLRRRGNSMVSMGSKVTSIGEDSDGKPRRNTGVPVDEQAVRQAHANIVAGACFALGLRFVGTASKAAQQVLIKYVKHFVKLRTCEADSPFAGQRPDKSTLETCLGTSAIALALVMAGTGDLETLRLLRSLRFKVDETVRFGNHMAIGSAIGILFLGGGRCSFSSDNASIATLVCSFYPRFPLHTYDNQYHLQALRHMYVLASEERCIDAYDIDTRSPCYLPLEITLREDAMQFYPDKPKFATNEASSKASRGRASVTNPPKKAHEALLGTAETKIQMVAPCLLPPLSWISSVRVASPRYWPVEISLDGQKNMAQKLALASFRVICVKRKVGHLSYMEDPRGVSSLLARPRLKLVQSKGSNSSDKKLHQYGTNSSDFMRAFVADPHVLAFAKHFCTSDEALTPEEEQFEEFCTATLYDCLTQEKPEMLNVMVNLYQTARVFKHAGHTLHVRNVQLLDAFYGARVRRKTGAPPLVGDEFLTSLGSSFRREIAPFSSDKALLRFYLDNLRFPPHEMLAKAWATTGRPAVSRENLHTLFATFLHYYAIPEASVLRSLDLTSLSDVSSLPAFAAQHQGRIPVSTILKMASVFSSGTAWK